LNAILEMVKGFIVNLHHKHETSPECKVLIMTGKIFNRIAWQYINALPTREIEQGELL